MTKHTTQDLLLTFNAGSSSIKIGLFELSDGYPRRIAKAVIDLRKRPPTFHLASESASFDASLSAQVSEDLHDILVEALDIFSRHFDVQRVAVVGHRVVHGADLFDGPVPLDEDTISRIEDLIPLAPLHQPQSLRPIRAIRLLKPELPQFASFDTAFHRSNADVVRRFAIPRALHDEGVRRYGFHGLSYKFIAGELARRAPKDAKGRVVVAHLGSGASLCALDDGRSCDTSMGFSTLDGVPMATRCGAIDPGVLLHLINERGKSAKEVEHMLYHDCGLLGISGISADSRELLTDDRAEARQAIDVFVFRIAGEIGRLAMSIGGLETLIFTAGIGENQPKVREGVCRRLGWLGLKLDDAANAENALLISSPESSIAVHVMATDEEQVIADEAYGLLHRG